MTKGQRRTGTQTLHISCSPISQCTSQDPSRQRGERGGGGGREVEEEEEERWKWERQKQRRGGGGELSTRGPLHAGIASLFLLVGKWKKISDKEVMKVNKKMACKKNGRYSVREEEGEGESGLWSFLISSNLTLRMPKPHFQGLICHMVCPVYMIY